MNDDPRIERARKVVALAAEISEKQKELQELLDDDPDPARYKPGDGVDESGYLFTVSSVYRQGREWRYKSTHNNVYAHRGAGLKRIAIGEF